MLKKIFLKVTVTNCQISKAITFPKSYGDLVIILFRDFNLISQFDRIWYYDIDGYQIDISNDKDINYLMFYKIKYKLNNIVLHVSEKTLANTNPTQTFTIVRTETNQLNEKKSIIKKKF